MKKYKLLLLGYLLLIPNIVFASNASFNVTCDKDSVKSLEYTSCDLTVNTSDTISNVEFTLDSVGNIELKNIKLNDSVTNSGSDNNYVLSTSESLTGNVTLASFDIYALSTYGEVGTLEGKVKVNNVFLTNTDNEILSGNNITKEIDITPVNNYTYLYELDSETGLYKVTVYKDGEEFTPSEEISIYRDVKETDLLSLSKTNTLTVTSKIDGSTLYADIDDLDDIELHYGAIDVPRYTMDVTDSKIMLKLLNYQSGVTYTVYRSTIENGSYTKLGNITGSYTDSNASAGVVYYYKIVATKDSDTITSVIKSSYIMSAPSMTLSKVNDTTARVSFTKQDYAESYTLYVCSDKTCEDKQVFNITDSSVDVTLTANKKYYFTMKTIYKDGSSSAFSDFKEFTIEILREVTNIKATAKTSSTAAPSIVITYDKTAGASGYIIKYNGNEIKRTSDLSYTVTGLKYGVNYTYTVTPYECLGTNCSTIKEGTAKSTNTVKINATAQGISVATTLRYDINKITINKPVGVTSGKNTVTYYIYRATNNGNYSLIKTISNPSLNNSYTYTDNISGAIFEAYYSYKVVVKIDSSSVTTAVKKVQAIVSTPTVRVENQTSKAQLASVSYRGPNVKYQIYRATSKNGTYSKICSGSAYTCSKSVTWNKTYYYKVRAYYVLNGKTKYTAYSPIVSKKESLTALDSYPVTYKVSGTNDTIKSVSVTRTYAGTSSKNAKFTFKLLHSKTVSSVAKTVSYKIRFYNYDKTKHRDVTISVKIAKGTKYSVYTSHTISVPIWCTQYDFI